MGMDRREFVVGGVNMAAALVGPCQGTAASLQAVPLPKEREWRDIDEVIRRGWDDHVASADENNIRADTSTPLLFLPFPYVDELGSPKLFGLMYAWDSDFLCRGLIAHERLDLAWNLIANYLFMIDRYGFMPNANVASAKTRSQTPLIADTVWRFYQVSKDRDIIRRAFPVLKVNYKSYWNAEHHRTPIWLATNRDLGDTHLPPELAAEAETGLDWTPIYGGDVRKCVPLITNCALVRYARNLADMAQELGLLDEATKFREEADKRARLIKQYCWNDTKGYFFEYDYVAGRQIYCASDCAYWTLWAGVASSDQARRLVGNLSLVEQRFGLSSTDRAYPLPLPQSTYRAQEETADGKPKVSPGVPKFAVGGQGSLQWMYPAGWAPMQLMAVEGLDSYGYRQEGSRIASRFLSLLINQYQLTGILWEKYNVVEGTIALPNSRYGVLPNCGWTMAAAAILGRRIFCEQSLGPIQGGGRATQQGCKDV